MTDGRSLRRSRQDRADMDRWLTANTVFGAVVAVALVAMAVIGSARSRDTQVAAAAPVAANSPQR